MEITIKSGSLIASMSKSNRSYLDWIPPDNIILNSLESNHNHGITIIDSFEINNLEYPTQIIHDYVFIWGLGLVDQSYYLLVHCNYFNKIRAKFNLSKRKYYLSLSPLPLKLHLHQLTPESLILKNKNLDLTQVYQLNDLSVLKYIQQEYDYTDDKIKILELKKNKSLSQNIDYLIKHNNYLGHIFQFALTQEIEHLKQAVNMYTASIHHKYDPRSLATQNMLKVLNQDILTDNSQFQKEMYLLDKSHQKIIKHPMPPNLSWLIPQKIGGISKLLSQTDLTVLASLGITKIYYFLEKRYFDHLDTSQVDVHYVHSLNTKTPSLKDMIQVLKQETFDQPVLFGCRGGFGRTGTALACYLCYYGLNQQPMTAEKAIHYLRTIRPKSIESDEQINFVRQFWFQMNQSQSCPPSKIKTPVRFIMLVGLPGSGKTTFCDLFLSSGLNVKIVTQDTMGRHLCPQLLLKFIKDSDLVILDRTNYLRSERQQWLSLTQLDPKKCLCIYLSTPKFICLNRVKERDNHPTIKKGGGERIIQEIAQQLEIPTKEEGFSDVIELEDQEYVREYLKTWKCTQISLEDSTETHIHKFPRTPHLFNIGGATVDDRYVSEEEYHHFLNHPVQITEKVDGAQLGFSLNDNYQIMTQNRSHYVNSKSASQFKILDKWVYNHRDDLYSILDSDHILFGEWLYAKHSIEYKNLPDYFMAFDLYNKREQVFYSRDILEQKLAGTQIQMVRIMYQGKIDKKQLLELIEQPSEYTDSRVEGVYLKIFEDKYVKYRSKLVRNDFLAGNQHWSKRTVEPNQLIEHKY